MIGRYVLDITFAGVLFTLYLFFAWWTDSSGPAPMPSPPHGIFLNVPVGDP